MNKIILFRCGWPAPPLWQNGRYHWAKVSKAKNAAKAEVLAMATHHGISAIKGADRYSVHVEFFPAARSRCDKHNLFATVKAHIDQIATCLGVDDRCFEVTHEVYPRGGKAGSVLFSVRAE